MIITLDVKKKTVISVEKDEDTKKEKVQPEKKLKLNSIEVDADFATILFTHASPGCAYYFYGGQ